ncbi:hypothetical protein GYB22_07490, partial [bacterium]|nr:hypothetical protein [bacterium]
MKNITTKIIKLGFLSSFLLAGMIASAQSYCASGATSTADSKCDRVVLIGNSVSIDNNTSSTGCQTYTDHTNLAAPDLSPGGQYRISMTYGTCGGNYTRYSNAWIDYNHDGDFDDAGETLGSWAQNGSTGYVHDLDFEVPCGITPGKTRLRVVVKESGATGAPCGTYTWGETEDYTVDLQSPTGSISANFFLPDTAFVGTIVNLVNSVSGGYLNEWDINNNGSVDYTTENAQHIFSSTGTYSVRLKVANCAGVDSAVKSIVIVSPTAPPVADFVATKNKVELFDVFQLIDLSTNGATYWSWKLINGLDTIDVTDNSDLQGGNPYVHKNPLVFTGTNPAGFPKLFPDRGEWDVCLVASNGIGSSSQVCKTDYVEVTKSTFNIGPETSLPNNIIGIPEGTLYDKGGPNNDYTVPEANLEALIAPCGAQSVTLNFKQFKLLANANLKVYDGVNALGTPLHTGSGFTAGNAPSGPITANSGTIYLLFNSSSGSTDSGFIATWTSVQGSGDAPVANFELPSTTFYNSVTYNIENTSLNAEGNVDFEWRVDGVVAGLGRDLENLVFYSNGSHTIRLTVIGCDGTTSTVTKTITVAHPGSPTDLDFVVSNQRPASGEVVTFTALSDKANRWEWTFFPGTDVSPDGPIDIKTPEARYSFGKPGKYTVQLIGYNSIDSSASAAAVIKANFVVVVDPCLPIISVTTSTDVSISKFTLTDATTGNEVLNNPSDVGVGYTSFIEDLGVIDLNYGATYDFTMDRITNINPMSRKIWIDWNVDGDFDDAGETVASQATGTSLTWTGSFTVPNSDNAFDATTRMRIGVSYGTD